MSILIPIYDYAISLNEIPDHITLCVEVANCQAHCEGCHSPYLWEDVKRYTELGELANKVYAERAKGATAVCLMGGTTNKIATMDLVSIIDTLSKILPVGLYSGSSSAIKNFTIANMSNLKWIKTGRYVDRLGGIEKPTSNQKFYERVNGAFVDCTERFRRNEYSQ